MNVLLSLFLVCCISSFCNSNAVRRASGFDCGSPTVLTQNNGEISSHGGFNAAHHYGKNMHCTWTIEAPAGMLVELVAEAFDVEDSPSCSYDVLALYDGNGTTMSPSIGKFCGNNFNPVTSTGRFLTLEFTTDDSTQKNGFKIFYNFTTTRVVACLNHQLACANGNCVDQSLKCDGDDDCTDDSDEQNCPAISTVCARGDFKCANKQCVPRDWLCDADDDCGDNSDERNCIGGGGIGGFTIGPLFPGAVQTSSAACGQLNYTGTSGSIQSPNYPSNYPDNTYCRYQIFAPAGTKDIAFKFNDVFSLEGAIGCPYDSVIVHSDGNSFSHGPFCNSTSPGQFTMPKDHAVIEFTSDDSDSYQGFKLDWKVIGAGHEQRSKRFIHDDPLNRCDFHINVTDSGEILSPQYGSKYPSDVICTWRLKAPDGKVIRLHFNQFALELSRRCFRDNVRIFDGVTSSADVIGQFCGRDIPDDVISTKPEILVFFFSDSSAEDLGFNISLTVENGSVTVVDPFDGCHGSIKVLNASNGAVTSPGYDGFTTYEDDQSCYWLITAPPGMTITVKIHDFLLEKIDGCIYDYLALFDGATNQSRKLDQLCGLQFPDDISSTGNNLLLHFNSDADVAGKGFSLVYTTQQALPVCHNFLCGDGSCILDSMVCNNFQECPDDTDEVICASPKCGKPAINPIESNRKVVGGREAIPYSWPWMVSLRLNQSHTCGGTLISHSWVLTAAHCFESNRHTPNWTVVAGKHYDKKSNPHLQVRRVTTIVVNSHYDYMTTDNDIAIVKVDQPFQENTYVSSVCLPDSPPVVGDYCFVTGWGFIENTCCPDVLKQAELPIISKQLCSRSDHLGPQITDNMFCAGYELGGTDACQGDSGGPFVCKNNSQWHIQGVISFGSGCADAKSPGVYTKVYNYLGWIRQKVAIN